jgi:hypothetical protein
MARRTGSSSERWTSERAGPTLGRLRAEPVHGQGYARLPLSPPAPAGSHRPGPRDRSDRMGRARPGRPRLGPITPSPLPPRRRRPSLLLWHGRRQPGRERAGPGRSGPVRAEPASRKPPAGVLWGWVRWDSTAGHGRCTESPWRSTGPAARSAGPAAHSTWPHN